MLTFDFLTENIKKGGAKYGSATGTLYRLVPLIFIQDIGTATPGGKSTFWPPIAKVSFFLFGERERLLER